MIRNPKQIQRKAKTHTVLALGGNRYQVVSGNSGNRYLVSLTDTGATCTCDWGKYRRWSDPRSGCSHVLAVMAVIYSARISAWTSLEDAKRQHRPMTSIGDGIIITRRKA